MYKYCVNNRSQPNGDHEFHKAGCKYWPASNIDLGLHHSCHTAVAEAQRFYTQSNGCAYCSPACHTS